MSLGAALRHFVQPGMHLHFASTPSRANAAIRELSRQFANQNPRFVISTTGMHSVAHLLALLRLGQRYISCFFGDNYPAPRPNALYQQVEAEGSTLEHWSLGSLVSAFRAGARNEAYAVTNSLRGTDLATLLEREGQYFEVKDPADDGQVLSLVRAKRADIALLHASVGDEDGNVLFCPPYCEGFHAALGARRGVIVTVESMVARAELKLFPQFLPLPAHRVLAVCQVSCGAHPQPLHVMPEQYRSLGYPDDKQQYSLWRRIALDPELFQRFCCEVLACDDDSVAYRDFVLKHGSDWAGRWPLSGSAQAASKARDSQSCLADSSSVHDAPPVEDWSSCSREMRATLLAARAIVRRATEQQYDTILAGIGQSFAAARLAKLLLLDLGYAPELVVETGLSGFDAASADPFLLGYRNIVGSRRLTDVEHVLGAVVCGNAGRCLAVIGAAQVDRRGRINSTRTSGNLLVGSGGANDIASAADEVLVIVRAQAQRLPENVEFVTSPGNRVRSIVSEAWEIARTSEQEPWTLRQWIASSGHAASPARLPDWCPEESFELSRAFPPSHREMEGLLAIGLVQDERSGNSDCVNVHPRPKRQHG